MGNSCGCTEQMFYKYFLGPPHVDCGGRNIHGVKLPFLFRDFVAHRVDPVGKNVSQKTYNEKDIRENGKSGKKSKVSC